jgi:ABC-type phosphate/phosphonate transport system substrate-binding protein
MKLRRKWSLLTMVLAAIFHFHFAFGQGEEKSVAPLTQLVLGYSAQVFFDVDVNDARAATKVWAEHFVRQKYPDARVETVIIPDAVSLEAALQTQRVDLFGVTALEYVELKDRLHLEGVLMTEGLQGPYEQFLIVARADEGFQNLADLRGMRAIVEGSIGGFTPLIWVDTVLQEQGLPPGTEFCSKVVSCSKPASVVLPVFFRQAGFCVVSASSFKTMTELNPQIGKELAVLKTSPGFATGVICFRNDLNKQYKTDLEEIMLRMHNDPRGQQLLTLFRVRKLIPFDRRHVQTVEELVRMRCVLTGRGKNAGEGARQGGQVR